MRAGRACQSFAALPGGTGVGRNAERRIVEKVVTRGLRFEQESDQLIVASGRRIIRVGDDKPSFVASANPSGRGNEFERFRD